MIFRVHDSGPYEISLTLQYSLPGSAERKSLKLPRLSLGARRGSRGSSQGFNYLYILAPGDT